MELLGNVVWRKRYSYRIRYMMKPQTAEEVNLKEQVKL